jgi:UDP-N-acetylmuramoylalanine--D-glutamate ligase
VKRKLVANQSADGFAVLNADDPACRAIGDGLPGAIRWFSIANEVSAGAWLADGRIKLRSGPGEVPLDAGPAESPALPGVHNLSNSLAAALAAWLAGAEVDGIAAGLAGFGGLRHRIQYVWRANGVDYYDDLNATSPQATVAALRALDRPLVLIAGGDDKGLDYGTLAQEMPGRVHLALLLPGPGSDRLAAALKAHPAADDITVARCLTLKDATLEAVSAAQPGDAVLLSPACPGFFSRHYGHSGGQSRGFRALLRQYARQTNSHQEESDARGTDR